MKKVMLALTVATATVATFVPSSPATNATKAVSCDRPCVILCGPSGCAETYSAAALAAPFTYSSFLSRATPVRPQSFYVVSLNVAPGENPAAQPLYFIPAASLIRISGGKGTLATWVHLSRAAATALQATVVHVPPYRGPARLRHAIVGHTLTDDPGSYLRLWTIGKPASSVPKGVDWIAISLSSDQASPWTDGLVSIAVSRQGNLLKREGKVLTIPAAIAVRIRAGRSLGK